MRIFTLIAKITASLSILFAISVTVGYMLFASNLPELSALSEYRPPLVSRVYNTEGVLLAEYADEHRILTPFKDIPQKLKNAFLAAEDQQFYEHPGINPARIVSAALANLRAGHTVQGGSTITQQVAKNFLLTAEKSYTRKIREAILAYRIEQAFSKDDILYLYLNHIYLGRGSYGVASAAWRYFHKSLDELTLAECATLAGLPKAPGRYAPHINHKKALQRRNLVLTLMQKSGMASKNAVASARHEILLVTPLESPKITDAYADQVYHELAARFGINTLRRQGLNIIVPYDQRAQKAAIEALRRNVLDVEQRQAYRYPKHHVPQVWPELLAQWSLDAGINPPPPSSAALIPALIESVDKKGYLTINDGHRIWHIKKPKWRWKRLKEYAKDGASEQAIEAMRARPHTWIAGDEIRLQGLRKPGVRISQEPSIESALYAIDLERGTVLARVGGYHYTTSGFDRVGKAKRQPGSAFKPFLYTSALAAGSTPAQIIMDTPVMFENSQNDDFWRPENYKNKFAGPVTLRNALEHSRNLASIKVLQNVGIKQFLNDLDSYPFGHPFPAQLALALGATEVTPEILTEAYIILANQGRKWKPIAVQQVQDRNGKTLHRAVAGNRCQVCHVNPVMSVNASMQPAEQVIDPVDAFLITNLMKGVIDNGTGRRARALHRPAAGKTGTTNKQVDAWFMGYTPQVLTAVWTGRDIPTSMGRSETGARAALPAWLDAMKAFHIGKKKRNFIPPEDIEWVAIDRKTGKLPGTDSQDIFLEAFRAGTAPTEATTSFNADDNDNQEESGFFGLGL